MMAELSVDMHCSFEACGRARTSAVHGVDTSSYKDCRRVNIADEARQQAHD